MFVATSRVQRELSAVAVDVGEKAAKDAASALQRLELSKSAADSLCGAIAYVRDRLKEILPAQQGVENIDMTPASAKAYRVCLITWIRVITKRAEADKQKGIETNAHALTTSAQNVLDQLHEQLSLPVVDITSFVEAEKTDENGDGQPPLELDSSVQPAPHRGKRQHPGAVAEPTKSEKKAWKGKHRRFRKKEPQLAKEPVAKVVGEEKAPS